MKNKEGFINEGGIIGADGPSKEWTKEEWAALDAAIKKNESKYTPEQKMEREIKFQKTLMEIYLQQDEPLKTVGAFIKEHLEIVGVSNKVFADYVEIEVKELRDTISGKRHLSLDLAVILGQLFEADADLWILIQNKNELLLLQEKMKEQLKAHKKINLKKLPKKAS